MLLQQDALLLLPPSDDSSYRRQTKSMADKTTWYLHSRVFVQGALSEFSDPFHNTGKLMFAWECQPTTYNSKNKLTAKKMFQFILEDDSQGKHH